jgi:hypothetical protein
MFKSKARQNLPKLGISDLKTNHLATLMALRAILNFTPGPQGITSPLRVKMSCPGVDVMITNFCDFCQFSAKNWRYSQKPMF